MTDRKQLDKRPTKNTEAKGTGRYAAPPSVGSPAAAKGTLRALAHEVASAFERRFHCGAAGGYATAPAPSTERNLPCIWHPRSAGGPASVAWSWPHPISTR